MVSPLFLRDDELRQGIELLYFAYRDLTARADTVLAEQPDLGRAHHRALYFIARQPGLRVSDLMAVLAVSKQSLGRVLKDLVDHSLVAVQVGRQDRRQRCLTLTEAGMLLEKQLLDQMKAAMSAAYSQVGPEAVTGFWQVLRALIHPHSMTRQTMAR